MVGVRSSPLPMSPDLFALLGQVVVQWSRVETNIVYDTSVMMRYPIVQKLTSEAPCAFNKKLELWRRSVRTVAKYRPLSGARIYNL